MKYLLVVVGVITLILPSPTSAQVDQRCWTQEACTKARTELLPDLTAEQALDGFIPAIDNSQVRDACRAEKNTKGELLGFCLPAGKSRTSIAFGGKKEFEGIGDFIEFGYRYAFAIATLLAVVMLIVGGVQWSISGGGEGKSAAQKRITNAIIGLVLLALSYALLSFVNPNLVNLRLPQTWLINPMGLASLYCSETPDEKFEYAGSGKEKRDDKKLTEIQGKATFSLAYVSTTREVRDPKKAIVCGSNYLIENGGLQTCKGDICPRQHVCYQKINADNETCNPGSIGGIIHNSNLLAQSQTGVTKYLTEDWEWPWANEPELYGVCKNGDYSLVNGNANDPDDGAHDKKQLQEYVIQFAPANLRGIKNKCNDDGGFKGFVLSLDMNEYGVGVDQDERHFIGINKNSGTGIDLGDKINLDADTLLKNVNEKYFMTQEELETGVRLNVDAGIIYDIDEGDDDRHTFYRGLGYR